MFSKRVRNKTKSLTVKITVAFMAVLFVVVLGPGLIRVDLSQASDRGSDEDDDRDDDHDNDWRGPKFCSQTAQAALRACRNEVKDDFWIAIGNCINVSDADEREECKDTAREERKDGKELCKEQFEARLEVCDLVGEKRYDPDFDPANFVSEPEKIKGNRYFPLDVGNRWVYEGTSKDDDDNIVTEIITVEVKNETKSIEGVTCRVVKDVVEVKEDGKRMLIEETDDWYAERNGDDDDDDDGRHRHGGKNTIGNETGDVWYCGEIARDFETFEDDVPPLPELVDIEGSWKAGRDSAKPGVIIEAEPQPGHAYRQEVSLGNAEDVAQVLSAKYSFGKDPDGLDKFVPEGLATLLCHDDCVVTRDFTALQPGVVERKYYAPGIGVFLEVNPETGEIVQLVECTTCPPLPVPAP